MGKASQDQGQKCRKTPIGASCVKHWQCAPSVILGASDLLREKLGARNKIVVKKDLLYLRHTENVLTN